MLWRYGALLVSVLALLGGFLWSCGISLDLTDESFYLIWSQRPWDYPSSLSQFGFVYHPLFALLRGDVVLARQINVLLTVVLAYALIAIVTSGSARPQWKVDVPTFIVRLALACSSLVLFRDFLLTPNYNGLTFHGLLGVGIGLACSQKSHAHWRRFGWIVIGISETLLFAAKPTSALVAGVAVLIFFVTADSFRGRFVLWAGGSFFMSWIALALYVDGSISGFIRRLLMALGDAHSLESGYDTKSLVRWEPFSLGGDRSYFYAALLVGFFPLLMSRRWPKLASRYSTFSVGALGAFSVFIVWNVAKFPADIGRQFGLLLFVPAALAVFRERGVRSSARVLGQVGVFAVMPYAYAFGTNTGYAQKMAEGAFFWIVAALQFVNFERSRLPLKAYALPASLGVLITTVAFASALQHPYRQPPMNIRRLTVLRLPSRSTVRIDSSVAESLEVIRTAAFEGGLAPQTPLIDLSGHSPGLVYFLGARSVGAPWLLGGYKGSAVFVGRLLSRVDCRILAESWVVEGLPTDERALPWTVLSPFGIRGPADFLRVVNGDLSLLKPLRTAEVLDACRKGRRN